MLPSLNHCCCDTFKGCFSKVYTRDKKLDPILYYPIMLSTAHARSDDVQQPKI